MEQKKREMGKGIGTQNEPIPHSPIPYSPLVKVSTKSLEEKIQISISDNGPGIPMPSKTKSSSPSLLPNLQVREQDWA
jgi:hypothetical protein